VADVTSDGESQNPHIVRFCCPRAQRIFLSDVAPCVARWRSSRPLLRPALGCTIPLGLGWQAQIRGDKAYRA
jgi:hypothetical protein